MKQNFTIKTPEYSEEYLQQNKIVISTFYKFCKIQDLPLFRNKLLQFCKQNSILGTILLGEEGINATVCALQEDIKKVYEYLSQYEFFNSILYKETLSKKPPFDKMICKIKNEIVTIKEKDVEHNPGEYIKPNEWDNFIENEDILLVDTRNDYEYHMGTFEGAKNPNTNSFVEFKEWCIKNIPDKHKKIAGFCTGGIRCEKSTSWLKKAGYQNVYHLEGGIIAYFIETKNKNKKWKGDCFVFDNRVVINDKLQG